jgi:hypothetical protein
MARRFANADANYLSGDVSCAADATLCLSLWVRFYGDFPATGFFTLQDDPGNAIYAAVSDPQITFYWVEPSVPTSFSCPCDITIDPLNEAKAWHHLGLRCWWDAGVPRMDGWVDGIKYFDDLNGESSWQFPHDVAGPIPATILLGAEAIGSAADCDIAEALVEFNASWPDAVFAQLAAGAAPLAVRKQWQEYWPLGGRDGNALRRLTAPGSYVPGGFSATGPTTWIDHPRLVYPRGPHVGPPPPAATAKTPIHLLRSCSGRAA